MSRTDAQLTWCHCSTCANKGPDGCPQTKRVARRHQQEDDARTEHAAGSSRQTARMNLPIPPVQNIPPIPLHHPVPDHDVEPDNLPPELSSPPSPSHRFSPFTLDTFPNDLFDPPSDHSDFEDNDAPFAWTSDSDTDPDWQFFQRSKLYELEDSTDEEHEQEPEGLYPDLADDPMFIPRASLFDASDDRPPDLEDEDSASDLPPAFYEHPAIRNTYVHAFLGCSFKGMTHAAARILLDGTAVALESARRAAPALEFPGLETMARTLPTVEKRLGVSTDRFITYLFTCPVCWKLHCPHELYKISAQCNVKDCPGTLFTVKRMADGKDKRTPSKIVPFVDPERGIAHMMMQPGKWDQIQEWRQPGDEPGRQPPIRLTGYAAFPNPDKPMHGIQDGWGWRAIQAGLVRRRTGNWEVNDLDVQRFVSLPCGLVWQINIDWFVLPYCFVYLNVDFHQGSKQ